MFLELVWQTFSEFLCIFVKYENDYVQIILKSFCFNLYTQVKLSVTVYLCGWYLF